MVRSWKETSRALQECALRHNQIAAIFVLDTLTLCTCHLYGFYVNALHSMMCRKVTLRDGISTELLNTLCELTYHCHVLMYNHFAVTLGNLGFLGTGECEKMHCGTNTQNSTHNYLSCHACKIRNDNFTIRLDATYPPTLIRATPSASLSASPSGVPDFRHDGSQPRSCV